MKMYLCYQNNNFGKKDLFKGKIISENFAYA